MYLERERERERSFFVSIYENLFFLTDCNFLHLNQFNASNILHNCLSQLSMNTSIHK